MKKLLLLIITLLSFTQISFAEDEKVTANHINYDVSINNFIIKKNNFSTNFVNYEGSTYINVNNLNRLMGASGFYCNEEINLYYQNLNNAQNNKQDKHGAVLTIEGFNTRNDPKIAAGVTTRATVLGWNDAPTTWSSITKKDKLKIFNSYNEGMKHYNSIAYKDDPFKTEKLIIKLIPVKLNDCLNSNNVVLIKKTWGETTAFIKLSDIAPILGSTYSFDSINRILNINNTNDFFEEEPDSKDLGYFEPNCIFLTNVILPLDPRTIKDYKTKSYDVTIIFTAQRYLELDSSETSNNLYVEIFNTIPLIVTPKAH